MKPRLARPPGSLALLALCLLGALGRAAAAEPPAPPPPRAAAPPAALTLPPALPAPGSPFHVDLRVDLPIAAGALVGALLPELFKGELRRPSCGLSCDAAAVNALDRSVIGNRSHAAQLTSDVFLGAAIGLPLALDLVDVLVTRPPDRLAGFGKDAVVLVETFALNYLLNNVVKFAVGRPRPLVYDAAAEEDKRLDPDAALSFYSGHSSTAFAMATAYSYLFMKRHPRSRLIVPVWILAEGFAASTAFLRVHAGKHFWTDVLTGAAVGAAIGLVVPYLHHRALAARSLQLTPLAFPDGMGLGLVLRR